MQHVDAFDFSYRQADRSTVRRGGWLQMRQRGTSRKIAMNAFASASEPQGRVIGGRPSGCPSSYCGCGAALRVFGRVIPELNLAANWLRFPVHRQHPGWSPHAAATYLYWNSTLVATCGWRRRQLWRACNTGSCSLIARIYSRESARDLIEEPIGLMRRLSNGASVSEFVRRSRANDRRRIMPTGNTVATDYRLVSLWGDWISTPTQAGRF
jgi:hypothetical protein